MAAALTSLDPLDDDDLPGDPSPAPVTPPQAAKPKPKPVAAAVEDGPEDPAPAPAAKPTKHTHPPRLVREATARGATQAYLDATDSATIWEAIHDFDAKAASRPKPAERAAEPEDEDEAVLKELDEYVDPKLAKFLRNQHAKVKEAKEYKAKTDEKLAALEQQTSRRRDAELNAMLDDAFDAMPAKFKKVLGDGSGADPAFLKTPEGKRRVRVFQEAGIDLAAATPKAVKRALLAAAETLFGFVEDAAEPDDADDPAPRPKQKAPPKDPESGRFTAEQFGNGKVAKGSARQTGLDSLDVHAGVASILRNGGYMAAAEGDDDDLPG